MITICAWHKKYFPDEAPPILSRITTNPGTVSHGMCKKCAEAVRRDWSETGRKRLIAAGKRAGIKQ